jgi:hypothetical protein
MTTTALSRLSKRLKNAREHRANISPAAQTLVSSTTSRTSPYAIRSPHSPKKLFQFISAAQSNFEP